MKRVKITTEDTVNITEVSITKYYGVISDGDNGFINREHFDCGKFKINSFNEITNGNGWAGYGYNNLGGLIRILLKNYFYVYEFDTWQELLEWAITK